MQLTETQLTIMNFVDENPKLTWGEMEFNKEKRIEFFRVCKEAGVEEMPEYPSDIDEGFFTRAYHALLIMTDGILEAYMADEEEEVAVTEEETIEEEVETVEENNNNCVATEVAEGENTMNKTTTTNKVTENAKAFAEAAQDKVEAAAKYAIVAVDDVKKEVKKIASMKSSDIEAYLKTNATNFYEFIKEKITRERDGFVKIKDVVPGAEQEAKRLNNILDTFSEILDDKDLNGWGKFKEIVKELVMWIARVFLKVGQIVLKLAITVVVGTIKIGAVAIDTTFNVIGVVNKEVLRPTVKAAKQAYANHKARKEELEEDFDDYDEMVEDVADEI